MARFRLRPDKPIQLSENDVELQCRHVLEYRGLHPIRLNSGVFLALNRGERLCDACHGKVRWVTIGEPGLPDYIVPAPADSFFLETKSTTGKLREIQTQKQWELEKIWSLRTINARDGLALAAWLDQNRKR